MATQSPKGKMATLSGQVPTSGNLDDFRFPDKVDTRIGTLEFDLGMPTKETAEKLYDARDYQRAVQAYIWALPMVGIYQAHKMHVANADAGYTDIVFYEGYRAVSVWLTANATTPYIICLPNLSSTGPLVVDFPAGQIAGMVDDCWQRPLTDVGLSGPDKGKGGKYLIVGPGQEADWSGADDTVHSTTNQLLIYYRVIEPDPKKAAALKTGVKVYPLSEKDNPPATRFLHVKQDGDLMFQTQPRGMEYWTLLKQAIDGEAVADRDRFFMATLRPLGLIKGKPFKPDARQTEILNEAALVGEAMAKANSFYKRFAGSRYRDDSDWDVVIQVDPKQDEDGWSEIDERAAYTYEAVSTSAGMVSQTPGVGSTYLGVYRDTDGHSFDGGKNYHLRIPPNPPAKQFWSFSVYENQTRTLIDNKEQSASRSSRSEGLQTNGDGSVDLYFGPQAPAGKQNNWIQTVPGRGWFGYVRLYGPLEAYFKREWPLPNIVLVK